MKLIRKNNIIIKKKTKKMLTFKIRHVSIYPSVRGWSQIESKSKSKK